MDNIAPITFHGGKRKRFDDPALSSFHFDQAFVGMDDHNKKKRQELYEKYSRWIVDDYQEFRDHLFKKLADKILEHLTLHASVRKSKDIVPMVAVLFMDTAIPAMKDVFDTLETDDGIGQFDVARLKTGGSFTNVEDLVDATVKQLIEIPETYGQKNGFQRLLQQWKANSKPGEEVKPILIILDDILSFDNQVLENFLFLIAQYKTFGLPFLVTAGFPQSNSITSILSARLVRKYAFEAVTVSMDRLVRKILQKIGLSSSMEMPFRLSPRAFKILALTATRNGITCDQLVDILHLVLLEHFRSKVDSVNCLSADELNKAAVGIDQSLAVNESPRKTRRTSRMREESRVVDVKSLLTIDKYRSCYLIAARIFRRLAYAAPESAVLLPDEMSVICAAADEDFFDSDLFENVLSLTATLELEDIEKLITYCVGIAGDFPGGVTSTILTDFKADLHRLKGDLSRLEELQEDENNRATKAVQDQRSKMPTINPNRSSQLEKVQQDIEKKKAVKAGNVLDKKKTELKVALKKFLSKSLVPPSEEAIATMYFDDIDFLRQILSPSTRQIFAAACSNPDYGARFDIFEESGASIDIAKWFEVFKDEQKENDISEEMVAARFYKMLSAMEFVGLISKSGKKSFVTKLCWTTGYLE